MSDSEYQNCFYLDSCVVLSDILGQNKPRIEKLKSDVKSYEIDCYVSPSVVTECSNKIDKTINFLDFVLKKVIIAYLEGIQTKPRDLTITEVSNEDLHRIREAFLLVNQSYRKFDLVKDPFQAVEEWLVEKLDSEVESSSKTILSDFIASLTSTILEEITKLQSDFETLVDLEASYISLSSEMPIRLITDLLISRGIHTADAVHISTAFSHQIKHSSKAVFLTFDYSSILLKWNDVQNSDARLKDIDCCDPIYGISFLR